MRTGRRGLIATAVTVVCAVTVLAAPGTAFASPAPPPTPADSAPPSASAPPAPSADPAPTTPEDEELEAVRRQLDTLYHDAAVATDAYNAAEEKVGTQSGEIAALAVKVAEGQAKLAGLKERAGAAARGQYRTGGIPPEAAFLLSDDPQHFLDGAGRVLEGHRATKGLIDELSRTQQDLEQYAADADAQWQELEATRKAKAAASKEIKGRIAAAEKLESRLAERQKRRLAELEKEAARRAQTAWLGTGILKGTADEETPEGRKAVAYATAQLGKPYEWGAEGPKTYDCSGLTSQAWASAGQPVPRTSQEQWKRLRHVPVEDMRPGDLIIYFDDASHVGMYVGDGRIVHAPRPGRTVTITGAGTMPILGAVRPGA
ncbi:NlpC/P60 family protein [Streptomyces sp. NPDC026672]|uniref:C40 family peptidase n=1 Tax=unclassified Streptomyces TaxID=2593676 RepID=UPI0033D2DFF9